MIFTIWRPNGPPRKMVIRMNKQEFSLFTMALKTYYPRENLLPNTQAMELWYQ